MRDALARGRALDDFRSLKKLLDLFFGEWRVIRSTRSAGKHDAGKNNEKRPHQGSDKCSHGDPPEIDAHCTPSSDMETTPITSPALKLIVLREILLYTSLPPHYSLRTGSFPSQSVMTQRLVQDGGCNEDLFDSTFACACGCGICGHACSRRPSRG